VPILAQYQWKNIDVSGKTQTLSLKITKLIFKFSY